jgi:hypothetical protein
MSIPLKARNAMPNAEMMYSLGIETSYYWYGYVPNVVASVAFIATFAVIGAMTLVRNVAGTGDRLHIFHCCIRELRGSHWVRADD